MMPVDNLPMYLPILFPQHSLTIFTIVTDLLALIFLVEEIIVDVLIAELDKV